jgi:transposase-like protein
MGLLWWIITLQMRNQSPTGKRKGRPPIQDEATRLKMIRAYLDTPLTAKQVAQAFGVSVALLHKNVGQHMKETHK